ncbi:Gfo/Idh/MocA family oxidoreductase [Botrimarina sp.]|uniref:Gfo/Idh/MocA family protein n=1 Tax=Botrimarina sp. TaxID=2795802 RepID=UPI0032EE7FBF
MLRSSRRQFLKSASLGGVAFASGGLSLAADRALSTPGERINVGMIGMGGRGEKMADAFAAVPGVRLAAMCDVDSERVDAEAAKHNVAARHTNYEDLLADPSIDAVVVTTCNHWHCLAAIHAVQAGKHVYVEKPLGHDMWQQEQLLAAVERSGKIAQIGTQQRSDPMQGEIKRFLHEEKALGEIQGVVACRLGPRGPIGKRAEPLQVSDSVDLDRWFGPSQPQPLYRNELHYDWHWDWTTGDGEMGNWGVHLLDDVRNVVFRDSVRFPSSAVALGARAVWDDAGQTPNVHAMLLDCGGTPVTCVVNNLPAPKGKPKPMIEGVESGYVVYAEGGHYEGQRGKGVAYDRQGNVIRRFKGDSGHPHHAGNFVKAVRENEPSLLNAPLEQGHASTAWCHYGNLAFLAGDDAPGHDALSAAGEESAWGRTLGAVRGWMEDHGLQVDSAPFVMSDTIRVDPNTGAVRGALPEAAQQIVKRDYRDKYAIPEIA